MHKIDILDQLKAGGICLGSLLGTGVTWGLVGTLVGIAAGLLNIVVMTFTLRWLLKKMKVSDLEIEKLEHEKEKREND